MKYNNINKSDKFSRKSRHYEKGESFNGKDCTKLN